MHGPIEIADDEDVDDDDDVDGVSFDGVCLSNDDLGGEDFFF